MTSSSLTSSTLNTPPVSWFQRILTAVLVILCVVFAAVRFIDLEADFPIQVSSSGAMYTDEGLYAHNALALHLTGQWYIPGEYNTAINYPVYSLMQVVAFKLFGPSLATLRAISVLCGLAATLFIFLLMRRRHGNQAALLAAAMILMNYRFLVYSRFGNMDIPTTPFIAAGLCALLWHQGPMRAKQVIICGILMFMALLVKTNALAGAAAAGLVILIHEETWRKRITTAGIYVGTLVACGTLYLVTILIPNWSDFRAVSGDVIDSRLTSGIGAYITTLIKVATRGQMDIDWYFLPLALTLGPVLAIFAKSLRREPVFLAGLAWLLLHLGLMAGLQYHPPRYFAAAVVPVSIVMAIIIDLAMRSPRFAYGAGALLTIAALQLKTNVGLTRQMFNERKHTLVNTAQAMKQAIDADKPQRIFVLSHSAATPLFVMQVESIGEHLGPASREDKIATHKPTHYIRHTKNLDEADETVTAFTKQGYRLEPMGTYRLLRDDIEKTAMYLYRVVKAQ